jgi:hypothetical protein
VAAPTAVAITCTSTGRTECGRGDAAAVAAAAERAGDTSRKATGAPGPPCPRTTAAAPGTPPPGAGHAPVGEQGAEPASAGGR